MSNKEPQDREQESVQDLIEDLDSLAKNFQKRYGTGDTGKEMVVSLSSAEYLIREFDRLSGEFRNNLPTATNDVDDTGKESLTTEISRNAETLLLALDLLADRYKKRFPESSDGDGDTGKSLDVNRLDSLFKDFDNIADRYRNRFDNLDGGDTGKDELTRNNLGGLLQELDDLASRYRGRLGKVDGGDGDTGK